MIKIPKELPIQATIGELYNPCSDIDTKEQADQYFELLVGRTMKTGIQRVSGGPSLPCTREEAIALQNGNIGYWSGYFDNEIADRMMRLFCCSHPVFGTAHPSPGEAVGMGRKLAKKERR
jgi:hypothetical protein